MRPHFHDRLIAWLALAAIALLLADAIGTVALVQARESARARENAIDALARSDICRTLPSSAVAR
jgi:hypothetical protein